MTAEKTSAAAAKFRAIVMFSGSGSVEKAIEGMYPGAEIESMDIKCLKHVNQCMDAKMWMRNRCLTIPPGSIDLLWASPPCDQYSVANTSGERNLNQADKLARYALMAISIIKPKHWVVENPNGLLKTRPFMQPLQRFLHITSYCLFGTPFRKHTCIWTNVKIVLPICSKAHAGPLHKLCNYKAKHGRHAKTAQSGPSKNGTPGSGGTAISQKVPQKLVTAILMHAAKTDSSSKLQHPHDSSYCSVNPDNHQDHAKDDRVSKNKSKQPTPSSTGAASIQLLHERMGHCDGRTIRLLQQCKVNIGVSLPTSTTSFSELCGPGCQTCQVAKARRAHMPAKPPANSSSHNRPLWRMSADITGPYPEGIKGDTYGLMFKCHSTGWSMAFVLKNRTQVTASLQLANDKARAMLRSAGHTLQPGEAAIGVLQTDNGAELIGGKFARLCNELQICQQQSTAYVHEQMTRIERMHGIMFNMVRPMLMKAGMPKCGWSLAYMHGAWIRNRLPSETLQGHSPYYHIYGKEDDNLAKARVMFCDAYAFLNPEERKDKLSPRAEKLSYVGHDATSGSYKLMNLRTRKIVLRYMVKFRENEFTHVQGTMGETMAEGLDSGRYLALHEAYGNLHVMINESQIKILMSSDHTYGALDTYFDGKDAELYAVIQIFAAEHPSGIYVPIRSVSATHITHIARFVIAMVQLRSAQGPMFGLYQVQDNSETSTSDAILIGIDPNSEVHTSHLMLIRGRDTSIPGGVWYTADVNPKELTPVDRFAANDTDIASAGGEKSQEPDFEIAMAAIAAPVVLKDDAGNDVSHPANRGQMLRAPDTAAWRESEDDEIRSNEKNKTLQLTTQTLSELKQQGYEIVSSTFVYKPKPRSDGKLDKRKTRLCARGIDQYESYDLTTFAATPAYSVLRLVIICALNAGVQPQQADIVSAFQIPTLREKICITLPSGYSIDGMTTAIALKCMQGFRQAAREWGTLSNNWIINYDRRIKPIMKAGGCLYVIWEPELKMMMIRWVDDYVGFSSDGNKYIHQLFEAMGKKFPIKILGGIQQVLGTTVIWGGTWAILRQTRNIEHIAEEYEVLKHTRARSTPITSDEVAQLIRPEATTSTAPFRQLLGEMMWVVMLTRPDMAFCIVRLASCASAWTDEIYQALLNAARFLYDTREYGIILRAPARGTEAPNAFDLVSYADASHGLCPMTKRSVTGTMVFLNGSLLSYSSTAQKTVAISSTESELMAATESARDVEFFRHMINEFSTVKSPSRIHIDNEGARFIASTEKCSKQSRHIGIRHFYCRELVMRGAVVFGHVPGTDNISDSLTKALQRDKYTMYARIVIFKPNDNGDPITESAGEPDDQSSSGPKQHNA